MKKKAIILFLVGIVFIGIGFFSKKWFHNSENALLVKLQDYACESGPLIYDEPIVSNAGLDIIPTIHTVYTFSIIEDEVKNGKLVIVYTFKNKEELEEFSEGQLQKGILDYENLTITYQRTDIIEQNEFSAENISNDYIQFLKSLGFTCKNVE